jgi:hypothetical protein
MKHLLLLGAFVFSHLTAAAEFRTQDNVDYVIKFHPMDAAELDQAEGVIKELAGRTGTGRFLPRSRSGIVVANLSSHARDEVAAMAAVKIIEPDIQFYTFDDSAREKPPAGPGFRTQDYVDHTIMFDDRISTEQLALRIEAIQTLSRETGTGRVRQVMDFVIIANLSTKAAEDVASWADVSAIEATRGDLSTATCATKLDPET